MRILLTGATGFVGSRLAQRMREQGHQVLTVSRRPGADHDWSDASLASGVAAADAIVHLAGAGLFDKRWSASTRRELLESRVESTRRLAALAVEHGVRCFVTASAIGYYGPSDAEGLDEETPAGGDFLARLCIDWEASAEAARAAGIRTAAVRIGVVLGPNGGALARMLMPFKLGLGGPIGTGRQWLSWIHLEDLCGIFLTLLTDESCRGAYNGTAPQPERMRDFAGALGRVLHRPTVLPMPGFALRLLLGEVAGILLTGQHVVPRRVCDAGFTFRFPELGYEIESARLAPDDVHLLEYRLGQAINGQDWNQAELLVEKAGHIDADHAGGALYEGQLALVRGRFEQGVLSLTDAVDRLPHSSMAWRSLALAHQALGDHAQAKEAFGRSYGANPNDVQTVRMYVALLTQTGDDERALQVLRNARRLVPGSIALREAWLGLEKEVGDIGMVLKLRRELYLQDPTDVANARQLATFLTTEDPEQRLLLDDAGVPEYAAGRWQRMSSSEKQTILADAQATWYAESDAIIDALGGSAEGEDLGVVVLRAALLRERGRIDEGEKVLRDFAGELPATDPSGLIALAQYQFAVGHEDDAERTMASARPRQDNSGREVDRALADLYYRDGNYRRAIEALRLAVAIEPDSSAELKIIECHAKLKEFDEADRLLRARIDGGKDGFFEQMLAANVAAGMAHELILDGDTAGAEPILARRDEALERAETLMPFSPEPKIQRAMNLLAAFNRQLASVGVREALELRRKSRLPDDALRELSEADQVQAGYVQTSLTRVMVLEAKGDTDAAASELERLLERSPDQVQARERLARLRYNEGSFDAAIATLDRGIERNPTLPRWHEMKGDFYLAEIRKLRQGGYLAARGGGARTVGRVVLEGGRDARCQPGAGEQARQRLQRPGST